MRTYGRTYDAYGTPTWVQVDAQPDGNFEYGWVTTLIQVLKLSQGESPFFSNYGIPAQRSVVQQVFPDFYVNLTQQQFSQYFASLQITKEDSTTPTYDVNIITTQGTKFQQKVAV